MIHNLSDKEIKEGLVFRPISLKSANMLDREKVKLKESYMYIVNIEWCSLCKCNHYTAKFVSDIKGTPKRILNYQVYPEEMIKANTIIIKQE